MGTIYIINQQIRSSSESRFPAAFSLTSAVEEITHIMRDPSEKVLGVYEVNLSQKTIKPMESYLNSNSKIWLQTKGSSEHEYIAEDEGRYFMVYEDESRTGYDVVCVETLSELKSKFLSKNNNDSILEFIFKADLTGAGRFMPLKVKLENFEIEFEEVL